MYDNRAKASAREYTNIFVELRSGEKLSGMLGLCSNSAAAAAAAAAAAKPIAAAEEDHHPCGNSFKAAPTSDLHL